MVDKDLQADPDQNQPSENFQSVLEKVPEGRTDLRPDERYQERDRPDHSDRLPDVNVEKGERHTHSQGINTCSDGEREENVDIEGVRDAIFVRWSPRLVDHLAPDHTQQHEGDPMVIGADVPPESSASQPAQERHDGLKEAEERRDTHGMTQPHLAQRHSARHRHGERIHGKTECDQCDFYELS